MEKNDSDCLCSNVQKYVCMNNPSFSRDYYHIFSSFQSIIYQMSIIIDSFWSLTNNVDINIFYSNSIDKVDIKQ